MSDELTAEELAELRQSAMSMQHGWDGNMNIDCGKLLAILAALRARDERIAELEGVAKAFLKEHDDTYDGGPISSGQVAAVELARTALEPRP
jgi:anthranilate phosphoribosyltransferase